MTSIASCVSVLLWFFVLDVCTGVRHSESGPEATSGRGFWGNLQGLIGDATAKDPKQMQKKLDQAGILLTSEPVKMAYKGLRDYMVFTDRRILVIDVQGITGRSIEYKSVPFNRIETFAVQSAGAVDLNSEVYFSTELHDFEQTLGRGEDLFGIQKLLAEVVLKDVAHAEKLPQPSGAPAGQRGLWDRFRGWWGDATAKDPSYVEEKFKAEDMPILLDDEHVQYAWKYARDYVILTTKRALFMSVGSLEGSQVEYRSIPYNKMVAFSIETAGAVDSNVELNLWTKREKINRALKPDQADLLGVQRFLSSHVLDQI